MPFIRTLLILIGGGACGAGLAFLLLSEGPKAPVGEATSSRAEGLAVEQPPPISSETRTVFVVTNDEQAHIQSQMIEFLVDLQNLNAALAEGDREWVRQIATAQATRRDPNGTGQQLRKKAPEGFTQISQSLRRDFSELSGVAGSEPIEELQQRLSLVTAKCVACHASYTVSTLSAD